MSGESRDWKRYVLFFYKKKFFPALNMVKVFTKILKYIYFFKMLLKYYRGLGS